MVLSVFQQKDDLAWVAEVKAQSYIYGFQVPTTARFVRVAFQLLRRFLTPSNWLWTWEILQ